MSLSKMPLFPLSYHFESFYFILPFIAFIILQYPSYSGLLSDVCLPLLECKIHKYRVFFSPLLGSLHNLSAQKSTWHVVVIDKYSWNESMKISAPNWSNGATFLVQQSESVGNTIFSISSCKAQAKENAYIQKFLFLVDILSETKQLQKHRHLNQNKRGQWRELLLRPLVGTAKSAFLNIKPTARS